MSSNKFVLTDDETKRLVEMYTTDGLPIRQIADRFGFSPQTCRSLLTNAGAYHRKEKSKSKKDRCFEAMDNDETLRNPEKLVEKIGVSRAYASTILLEWKTLHGMAEKDEVRYLMLNDLEDLKQVIRIGDKIYLPKELYSKTSVVVTIKDKYPNFAITDKGAKRWFDIFDAVWNVPENKEVLERCQKLQTA